MNDFFTYSAKFKQKAKSGISSHDKIETTSLPVQREVHTFEDDETDSSKEELGAKYDTSVGHVDTSEN